MVAWTPAPSCSGHGRRCVDLAECYRVVPMRPMLMINPPSDAGFVDAANDAVDRSGTPETLADALRPEYPSVSVRARDLSDETIVVWYVYRDGHWVGS